MVTPPTTQLDLLVVLLLLMFFYFITSRHMWGVLCLKEDIRFHLYLSSRNCASSEWREKPSWSFRLLQLSGHEPSRTRNLLLLASSSLRRCLRRASLFDAMMERTNKHTVGEMGIKQIVNKPSVLIRTRYLLPLILVIILGLIFLLIEKNNSRNIYSE